MTTQCYILALSRQLIHLHKFSTIMNYKFLYCIILFVCISQVGYSQRLPWRNLIQRQQTQQQIPTIEVNPGRISYGNIRLSDIIESIEYIPLETTDESLVAGVSHFDISDNYIVVYCSLQTQVFLFSRDGRFIRRIGRQGQGPGEYIWLINVFLDEKRDRVFVVSGHEQQGILVYNLQGEFVKNMTTQPGDGRFQRLHNEHFFINNVFGFHSPFAYEVRDIDLQLVAESVHNEFYGVQFTSFNVIGSPTHYLFNDEIHVRRMNLNDTVFVIENDFSFTPRFVVSAGRLAPTIDVLLSRLGSTPAESQRARERFVSIGSIFETANKLLFRHGFQGRSRFTYFDKNAGRLLNFRSESGIPNDFDGGVDFWPRRQDNLIWYRFFYAYYLIENSGGITPTGGTAAVQSFNRLIERLDPDDNPVLMIVRIRE